MRRPGLTWVKYVPLAAIAAEPADAPANWCQGSEPTAYTNLGICHYTINGECPDWCYECSDTPLDCFTAAIDFSAMVIRGLGGFCFRSND